MALELPADTLAAGVNVLTPFSKRTRLDGSSVPATILVGDGVAWLRVVPDLPRVTAVTAYLGDAVGEGSVTVAAERLLDICRRASGVVDISEEGGVVTAGPWQTPVVEPGTLPAIGDPSATVSVKGFLHGLEAVKGAASTDLLRPRLGIVHFGRGFARACDGLRYREERVSFDDAWDVSVFLAPMLSRFLGSVEGDLTLSASDTHQGYTAAGVQVIAPKPSAEYMDLDEVVAAPARAHNNLILKIDRAALMDAVRDAAIMSGEHSVVTLDLAPDLVTVSASDGGANKAHIELVSEWGGDARTLRFYADALLQLLRTSQRDNVELRLGTSTLRQLTAMVVWEDDRFALLNQVRREAA